MKNNNCGEAAEQLLKAVKAQTFDQDNRYDYESVLIRIMREIADEE